MHTYSSRPIAASPQAQTSKTLRLRVGFLLSLLALASVAANAQYMGAFGVPYNNPVSATLSTNVWNNWVVYELQRKKAQGAQGSTAGSSTTSPSSAPKSSAAAAQAAQKRAQATEASLRFQPTGTRLLTPKLVESLGKTQVQKDQVSALVTAIFQEFDKQAQKLGKPNDLAFALSYFLAQNATLYRGKPDPKDEQFLELRETVAAAMGQSGGFAKMTDRQKQETYEMLVSYTGLVYATYLDAKQRGDKDTMKTMRELAGLNLKSITHIEPERINFTDQGFTIK
jgi:hypothetical protein